MPSRHEPDPHKHNSRIQRLIGILIGAALTAVTAVFLVTGGQPPTASTPAAAAAPTYNDTASGATAGDDSGQDDTGIPAADGNGDGDGIPADDSSTGADDPAAADHAGAGTDPAGDSATADADGGAAPDPADTPRRQAGATDGAGDGGQAAPSPAPEPTHPPQSSASCTFSTDRTTVIARGMTGLRVSQAQCLLKVNYGYHLAVDGDFGPATDQAVRQMQRCAGLAVDGKVGPRTWPALYSPPPTCRS